PNCRAFPCPIGWYFHPFWLKQVIATSIKGPGLKPVGVLGVSLPRSLSKNPLMYNPPADDSICSLQLLYARMPGILQLPSELSHTTHLFTATAWPKEGRRPSNLHYLHANGYPA